MDRKANIALSALAASLSAAGAFLASSPAFGDPPPLYCYVGTACGLAHSPHSLYVHTDLLGNITGQDYADYYDDVGVCGFSNETCGCAGWVGGGPIWLQTWYGNPWNPDYTYQITGYMEPEHVFHAQHPECWNY